MTDRSFRVATFNIHHAEGRDGVLDLDRIAAVISDLEADLVALQELDVGTRRSQRKDEPAELADLLGMHVYFAPVVAMDPGEYGIALAAREEFRATIEPLPRLDSEEPRTAIVASWNGIGVITTHLSRNANARKSQTEHLAEVAGRLGEPCVLLGDLNQPARALGPLRAKGLREAKPKTSLVKSLKPGWPIDHILVSSGLEISKIRLVETKASDHPVLVASIEVSDA